MSPSSTKISKVNILPLSTPTEASNVQLVTELNNRLAILTSKLDEVIEQVNKLSYDLSK
jgi:hypothetical protein